jgi:ribosome-associated protein
VEHSVDVQQNGRHLRRVYEERRHGSRDAQRASPLREIELRFSRSSGRGQHAQRTETRVEALFDVEASSALTARQKTRVLGRTGPIIRAVAQDERSQWRNRELAIERVVEALRAALAVRRPRRATAPTQASVERRLESKRRRAAAKRLRRPPERGT